MDITVGLDYAYSSASRCAPGTRDQAGDLLSCMVRRSTKCEADMIKASNREFV